jgi:hypothetical protein
MVEEVCDIIRYHHHPRAEEGVNFRCVHDANQIANLEEENKKSPVSAEEVERIVDQSLLTESGRDLAREVLLSGA